MEIKFGPAGLGPVKDAIGNLEEYPLSSFPDYINSNNGFLESNLVLDMFGSRDKYKQFVFDQADYQRKLDHIKHLTLE